MAKIPDNKHNRKNIYGNTLKPERKSKQIKSGSLLEISVFLQYLIAIDKFVVL
jgi:hypothetical protein